MNYANIIVNISHENLDRTFQYRVPDNLVDVISVGDRVTIPFGVSNRERSGFVLGLSEEPKIDPEKIKDIIGVLNDSSLVEQKLISLAYFIKTKYGNTYGLTSNEICACIDRAMEQLKEQKNGN